MFQIVQISGLYVKKWNADEPYDLSPKMMKSGAHLLEQRPRVMGQCSGYGNSDRESCKLIIIIATTIITSNTVFAFNPYFWELIHYSFCIDWDDLGDFESCPGVCKEIQECSLLKSWPWLVCDLFSRPLSEASSSSGLSCGPVEPHMSPSTALELSQ